MVKTLNTKFPVEHSGDNTNIIYVESLNNVYKDLYHATTNGEKSVLKAIEEGDGYIVASTKITYNDETSKQLVRIEEGAKPKVCLDDNLFGVVQESNKEAQDAVMAEAKVKKQAKADVLTSYIFEQLDEQVQVVAKKAQLDFNDVIEVSNEKIKRAKNKTLVKKEEKVVVEKAKADLKKVEEETISETAKYLERQLLEDYNPEQGDKEFQGDMKALKSELEAKIKNLFEGQTRDIRKIAEMSSGGGGNESRAIQNSADIATLSADVGEFENVTVNQREQFQGYISLLSPVYFGGSATTFNIPVEDVNTWVDVELEVDPEGTFDYRVTSMKTAQLSGYEGTGATGDPIIFDLEGLELTSSADIRVSMSFNPDDDGGRLDSRLNFFRHSGIALSATNFHIEASSLAMESGADESYAYLPGIKFFIGDTIDTNGPGDAGRVCFQIKSDVPGTVTMNEIAMFIQK